VAAYHACAQREGIIPALESAHALALAQRVAAERGAGDLILVNVSGRGDKDTRSVATFDGEAALLVGAHA
jgi:tryptophan synthase beta chain